MATTQFVTAQDDSAHGNVDETHFESHKFQVQCSEADVGFSILSAGKTSQQRNWLEGYQVMLPGTGGQTTRTCAKDSNVAKLEQNRRVYWLPGSAAESTDGAPLNLKFRVARLVVEATTDSETEFDASQLEESEETRRLKHKTILRHVNMDIHDARRIAHLQSCGAFRPADRTRLIKMRAVRNPVCDAPKAPSSNAERFERASQKVEKRSRTSRSWFEGKEA